MRIAACDHLRKPIMQHRQKEGPMTRRIKWGAAIGVAVFIIGALIVVHYSLRIGTLMGSAH